MTKLFEKKDAQDKRTVRIPVRLLEEEKEEIIRKAQAAKMTTSEFIRRLALDKKIDVRYEEDIIEELRWLRAEIRGWHLAIAKQGVIQSEEAMTKILFALEAAVLRIFE